MTRSKRQQTGTVVFAHGLEGAPWGTKIRRLAAVAQSLGYAVASPDFRGMDSVDERVRLLQREAAAQERPLILAGSSLGAYVALIAARELAPAALFLLAPAVGLDRLPEPYPVPHAGQVCIVHGWNDDTVPVARVYEYAKQHGAELHLLRDGHRLHVSLDKCEAIFEGQLRRLGS